MRRRRKTKGFRRRAFALAVLALGAAALACLPAWIARWRGTRADFPPQADVAGGVLVTGYCNCGKCCGWKRNWFGFGVPVYDYGPMKGKRKKVGVTARGTKAKHGTVAADPVVFKFGTRLEIPGYGTGVVEDVGGSIKGRHVDVWFPSHDAARKWGARKLAVRVLPAQ